MREAVSSLRGAEVPEAVGEALATLIEHVVLSATAARTVHACTADSSACEHDLCRATNRGQLDIQQVWRRTS